MISFGLGCFCGMIVYKLLFSSPETDNNVITGYQPKPGKNTCNPPKDKPKMK